MDEDRARAIAERLHAGEREEDGSPVLEHVRRVALATAPEARVVAWLHEALECGAITERELLAHGVTPDELGALRLLDRTKESGSDAVYLAHVELIAEAAGRSGTLARSVKRADLEDRLRHPRVRPNGWSPPYDRGLARLRERPPDGGSDAVTPGR
jgi:hypothetical protein